MNLEVLKEEALKVREYAHVPYSSYHVGVALLGESGKVYTGCNVENHGIQAICGERVAFAKAISEGEKQFKAIFVTGGYKEALELCLPCGYCRQFMSEFVSPDFSVFAFDGDKTIEYKLSELLPFSFKFDKEKN